MRQMWKVLVLICGATLLTPAIAAPKRQKGRSKMVRRSAGQSRSVAQRRQKLRQRLTGYNSPVQQRIILPIPTIPPVTLPRQSSTKDVKVVRGTQATIERVPSR